LGNERIYYSKDDYTNEALNQFILNNNDLGDRCLEHEGRLIQRIEPSLFRPTESNLGSAHFYAPNKRFMGSLFPTYWFNMAVIWLMSISLMVMLIF
jgi:hypothetical protein